MLHSLQHITDLIELCFYGGVRHAVISPGSRNAPLIGAFVSRYGDKCFSIVDERSAGYFAMGMARYLREPVALLCTSGTAVLNYSPALAEAYYSHVPLLAITADRPAEWIDQQDNQTIRQRDVYKNFIKRSYHLPEIADSLNTLHDIHHQIREALSCLCCEPKGPVHINVPLHEPLYTELPHPSEAFAKWVPDKKENDICIPEKLRTAWQQAERIVIVHGQDHPGSDVGNALSLLCNIPGVVVIAENISNIHSEHVIAATELLFSHIPPQTSESPELLLYSGGQVVSGKLKNYLRSLKNIPAWRIGVDEFPIDTFKQNNSICSCAASLVYSELAMIDTRAAKNSEFKKTWEDVSRNALKSRKKLEKKLPFSEVIAMKNIMNTIPQNTILEIGNSSVVRIFQLFNIPKRIEIFSNRGVSGIDGSLSAAAGTAAASGKLTVAIIGDLSFVYDSNALWNRRLPSNLRIIILNNQGGGIFSLLDGPSSRPGYEDFFIAHHPVSIQKLAEAFYLNYFCVTSEDSLVRELEHFFQPSDKAGVLEIITNRQNNVQAFNSIMGKPCLH